MLWIPALAWAERPVPFQEITGGAPRVGLLTLPMLLLGLLLAGYLGMAWVAWRSQADLPWPLVGATCGLSAICATFTYSLFANDVYVLLANVWTLTVPRVNPYEVPPLAVLAGSVTNPYDLYAGSWAAAEFVYGPAWLLLGAGVMKLVGPGVGVNYFVTKLLHLGIMAAVALTAWRWAILRGSPRPVGVAALVAWNPLLLVEGVMTPHLDLPMAAALLGCLVAWLRQERWDALAGFALSVAVKFVTLVLAPAMVGALVAAGAIAPQRWRALLWPTVALAALAGALWPGVWQPFWQHGLPTSLGFVSPAALVPNVVRGLESAALLPPDSARDPVALARVWRWVLFVPLWSLGTLVCVYLARARPRALPVVLVEPLALILLGYHTLFTVWVQPWHFTAPLALCLIAGGRRALVAGLLITASGLAYTINAQWLPETVLRFNDRIPGWIQGASLLPGAIVAMALLGWSVWSYARSGRAAPPAHGAMAALTG